MEYVFNHLARAWDLSPAQYWHLRLLSALLFGPLLGVLWVVVSALWEHARSPRRLHH